MSIEIDDRSIRIIGNDFVALKFYDDGRALRQTIYLQANNTLNIGDTAGDGGNGVAGGAPSEAQYLVLNAHGDLSNERVFVAGNGLSGSDAGAGNNYTLAIGAGDGIDVATASIAVDVTDFIDTSYGLTENVNDIRVNLNTGLAFSGGGIQLDWSGTPTTIEPDASTDAGASSYAAHTDHVHAIVCAVPIRLQPDAAQAEGAATSFARSDHGHQITCAAPGSNLAVDSTNAEGSSANDFSRADHSHAITTSSNPGANAHILASDATGRLELEGLGIGASPTGQETRIDGNIVFVGAQSIVTTVDALTLQPVGNLIIDPDSNAAVVDDAVTLKSNSYASQTTGWGISGSGSADFRYLFVDELHAKTFIADLEQALAGGQIIAKSVAILASDFTCPTAGNAATLTVEDLPGASGSAVFQANDFVGLRQFSRSAGSLTIAWCWGLVTSYVDNADGTQNWTFTRDSTTPGSASGTIEQGTLALDFGVTGNGYYEVNAIDGAWGENSPYAQIVTWATHPATRTVRARLGQLKGVTSVDEYGLLAGSGVGVSDQYFRFSDQNIEIHNIDLTIHDGVHTVFKVDRTTPYYALGSSIPTAFNSGTGVWAGNDSDTYKWRVGDPSGRRAQWTGSDFEIYDDDGVVFKVDSDGGWLSSLALTSTLGDMFFTKADGLLLLGPSCEINATEWWSLRRQKATISGAFHQEAGRWGGTRGLVIEEATTNLITNPSFETNTTSWTGSNGTTLARVTTLPRSGGYCLSATTNGAAWGNATYSYTYAASTTYTLTVWVRCPDIKSGKVYLKVHDGVSTVLNTNATSYVDSDDARWTRLEGTFTTAAGAGAGNVQIATDAPSATMIYYADGVQLEQKAYKTSYCDGSLGSGYSWSGTAHASTSTRTQTGVDLDGFVDIINSKDTLSFRFVVQAPYDYNTVWPTQYNHVFDAWGASGRIYITYDATNDYWWLQAGGDSYSVAKSFNAGDWLDIVWTVDHGNNSRKFYINGELLDEDTTAISAQALTKFRIGTRLDNTFQWGAAFSEAAVFDDVLTAAEVAQLYALQRPLVDAGAQDSPGVYILDGQFVLATSTTGARTKLDASGWYAYDVDSNAAFGLALEDGVSWGGFTINKSDLVLGHNKAGSAAILWDQSAGTFGFYGNANATVQVEVATDGSLTAGGGNVKLNANGIGITPGSGGVNAIWWGTFGSPNAWLWGASPGTSHGLDIGASTDAGQYAYVYLLVDGKDAGDDKESASLYLEGKATNQSYMIFKTRTNGGAFSDRFKVDTDAGYFYDDLRIGGGLYVGATNVNPDDNDIYIVDNCSALSFTDRTPYYQGDALAALRNIRANEKGAIDHATLPEFARRTVHLTENGKDIYEESRDLGAMVSILTVAVQQMIGHIEALEGTAKLPG